MPLFMELSLLIECQDWAERAIARLGDQHKNSRREMEIYSSLSLAVMHTEGSSERVREAFSRALDVAAIQGDSAYELRLLSGLFMYYRWNIDINAALDIASQSKEVALKTRDPDDMALAESMLGAAHHLAAFARGNTCFITTAFCSLGWHVVCCTEVCLTSHLTTQDSP